MFNILLQTARDKIVSTLLFTFPTTFIVYSIKKVHETCWHSRSIACKEKRTDWIIRIFTFNNKKPLYFSLIMKLQFF